MKHAFPQHLQRKLINPAVGGFAVRNRCSSRGWSANITELRDVLACYAPDSYAWLPCASHVPQTSRDRMRNPMQTLARYASNWRGVLRVALGVAWILN